MVKRKEKETEHVRNEMHPHLHTLEMRLKVGGGVGGGKYQ